MRRRVFIVAAAVALFGCRHEYPPVVSGGVVDGGLFLGQFVLKRPGQPPDSWSLTESQLAQLGAWLSAHQSDWSMDLGGAPPPAFSIILKHADGGRTQIDLYDINEAWLKSVHIRRSNPAENGTMRIDAEERKKLIEMVRKKSDAG
jgi:hypothetical protein